MAIKLTKEGLKEKIREVLSEQTVGLPMHFRTVYDDIGDGRPFEKTLMEGLIKTYPMSYVENFFKRRYTMDVFRKNFDYEEGRVILVFYPNSDAIDEVIKTLDRFGYFLSWHDNTTYQFEPKFQNEFTVEDLKYNGCRYLLHVSPVYNKEKILQNGLSPVFRNDEFTYPGRIYLFLSDISDRELKNMTIRLSDANRSKGNNGVYTLYRISFDGLWNAKFCIDHNANHAVYTQDNIPPSSISEIGEIDTNGLYYGLDREKLNASRREENNNS